MGEARRKQRVPDGDEAVRRVSRGPLDAARAAVAAGDLERAVALYSDVIRGGSTSPEVFNDLGAVLARRGQLGPAVVQFEMALMLAPDHAAARANLTTALETMAVAAARAGRWADAAAGYRRLTDLTPGVAIYYSNAGAALRELGQPEVALPYLRRAVELEPARANIHHNLGAVLLDLARDEAASVIARAIELDPTHVDARINLALIHDRRGRLDDAATLLNSVVADAPRNARAHANLASVLREQGDLEACLAHGRLACALEPDVSGHVSTLLLARQSDPSWTREAAFQAHREWARRFAAPLDPGPAAASGARARDPGRRLRVGYVSPDLRQHPVASFCAPIIAAHDRAAVEVFCYSDAFPDAVTEAIRSHADSWHDTRGLGDAELAARVAADGIDVLVDLAGHTGRNRLLAFARRPAPVQVTYCGYPDTTGMAAMGWRLTDADADPEGAADAVHSERLWRLPTGFLCYQPPGDAPSVGPLPVERAGRFTFGSFNNWAKVAPDVIAAWAMILARVPDSDLLLKSRALVDQATVARARAAFARAGVAPERIRIAAYTSGVREHLACYQQVDLALDPFPYCGTTTTCEALWMGVPVVSLRGQRHVARVGASLLARVGLSDLVAGDVGAYVERAVALASPDERPRLAELRASLRHRMSASTLCDPARFTRALEAAYRGMWTDWCAETSAQ